MHSTHRFFLFFFLAFGLIFANLLFFSFPSGYLMAQAIPDYLQNYQNKYASFIQVAYNDYTGLSYSCASGFTNKGYFKPDGAAQTSADTANDFAGKKIKSGWLQLCVNNSYSNSVLSRYYDDYNPYKTVPSSFATSTVIVGTASGVVNYIRDNNESTAYGVTGSCSNTAGSSATGVVSATGHCSLGFTAQVNIPFQSLQAFYVNFSFNAGNTSGQVNANYEVLSNGVWVKASSEGGTTSFDNHTKIINSNSTGGATPWPKVTAIRMTVSETATYSVCPTGTLCKATIPNSFSIKEFRPLNYAYYNCPSLYPKNGGYFKIDATAQNLTYPSGVDYAGNRLNSGWLQLCKKATDISRLEIAYNDYTGASYPSCQAKYLWAGNFKPDSVAKGGGVTASANGVTIESGWVQFCAQQLLISDLSYGQTSFSYNAGQAITAIKPTYNGLPAKVFSISPAFSNGLKFNTSTGVISGTPILSKATDYTITATNAYGSATVAVSIAANTLNLNYLHTGNSGTVLKLGQAAIDETNRRLYVTGTKTTNVGVMNLDTDKMIDYFDIGVNGGFLIFNNNTLYLFDFSTSSCYQIDLTQKKANSVSLSTCTAIAPDTNKTLYWKNYAFKMTGYTSFPGNKVGFPTTWSQDYNGAYGIIEIHDYDSVHKITAPTNSGRIIVNGGPDSLYHAIDSTTGKLYTTNTGDATISVFDLNKLTTTNFCSQNSCWLKNIDVGTSVDQMLTDSQSNLYARTRIGGSTIFKFNTKTNKFTVINNENVVSDNKAIFNNDHLYGGLTMWPAWMELSQDEQRLYVLGHYGADIDVIDTTTNAVAGRIQFTTDLKPRTDSISTMVIDKTRDRLYVAWPELGIVGIADGLNKTVLGTIDLTQYGFDRANAFNEGPGTIILKADSNTNKLFVYLVTLEKLLVFNGDSFVKESESIATKIQAVTAMGGSGAIHEKDVQRDYSDSNFTYSTKWNDGIITVK